MRPFLRLAVLAVMPVTAFAAEPVPLSPGPNVELVSAMCNSCHTSNYIIMNSVFMSAATWKAEVAKMRNAFGAPIDDAMQAQIADYLIANYGAKP